MSTVAIESGSFRLGVSVRGSWVMAAIDLGRANGLGESEVPVGPSDREVIEALQRIASAQAHLEPGRGPSA